MKILLNDREEEFDGDEMSVSEMLNLRKFTFKLKIVKVNGALIPRENYETAMIRNGDVVQMLYLMSGG